MLQELHRDELPSLSTGNISLLVELLGLIGVIGSHTCFNVVVQATCRMAKVCNSYFSLIFVSRGEELLKECDELTTALVIEYLSLSIPGEYDLVLIVSSCCHIYS